jgi:hypothetical protein
MPIPNVVVMSDTFVSNTIGTRGVYLGVDNSTGYFTDPIVVPTNGLTLYLDAGLSTSYSGSGNQWYDLSGNSNTATLQNSPTYSSSNQGVLTFNGSNQYASISSPVNIPIGNSNYTISVWFNANSLGANGLVGWGNFGTSNQANALRLGGQNLINYWWGNDLAVSASLATNTWYNVVARFDGTNREIWLNNVKLGGDTPSGHNVPNANNFRIASTNNGEYFNGRISNVEIYNRAISDSEIAQIYNNLSNRFSLSPTPSSNFWNGYIPGASGYVVYIKKASSGPSIYAPDNDSILLDTADRIAESRGDVPTLNTVSDALIYLNSKQDMICVNMDYPPIVTNGLVLMMDAAFTTSYPKGGTGWFDLSTSSKTGLLTNGVSYSTNNLGSLNFNSASTQFVEVPELGSLSNFTVSCWFKLNTLPTTAGAAAVVSNVYNLSTNLNFSIGLNRSPSSANICGGFYNGTWRTTAGFAPSIGVWYNVAVTYNGTRIIQYLDGSSQSTLDYTGTASSGGLGNRIGRSWDTAPNSVDYINGQIPHVMIYNRALTSTEIVQNYNAIKDRYI